MKCYKEFCVYEKNGVCLLDEIEVDETGMCSCCICIDISKDLLSERKEEILLRFSKE